MADEVSQIANSSAQDFTRKVTTLGTIAATVFGAVVGQTIRQVIDQSLTIDRLREELDAARMASFKQKQKLMDQSKDVHEKAEDLENEYEKTGVPALIENRFKNAGLPAPTPHQAAIEEADRYWLDKYGDTIGFVKVENRNVSEFEQKLAKNGIDFTMLPVQADASSSIYLVDGGDIEKINEIADTMDHENLIMSNEDAAKLFNHQLTKEISGMNIVQCQKVQGYLEEKGIPSQISIKNDKPVLVARTQDIENNREYFDKAMDKAFIISNTRVQSLLDKNLEKEKAAYISIDAIDRGDESRSSGIIYDAAHPENSIEFKQGGVIQRENENIVDTIDTSIPEGKEKLKSIYNSYAQPILEEKTFRDLQQTDYIELTDPYAKRSYLETRMAKQEQILDREDPSRDEAREKMDRENEVYEKKLSRNTDEATRIRGESDQIKYNPAQSLEDFIMEDDRNDGIDDTNTGRDAVIKALQDDINSNPKDKAKELSTKVQEQRANVQENDTIYHTEELEVEDQSLALEDRNRAKKKDHEREEEKEDRGDDLDEDIVETHDLTDDIADMIDEDKEEAEEESHDNDFDDGLSDSDFESFDPDDL